MKIVAISGSLRAASTNSALVRAAATLAPAGVEVAVWEGLDGLPHFSPERDSDPPEAVQELRTLLGEAAGALVCTPEYAYGMPGSLKNALDWLVSSGELWRKPVAALSASPSANGGDKAHAALMLTLAALEAEVVPEASLRIPFARTKVTPKGEVTDPDTVAALRKSLAALVSAAHMPQQERIAP